MDSWEVEREDGLPSRTGQLVSLSVKLVGLNDKGGSEGAVSRALPLPLPAAPAAGDDPGLVISVPTLPGIVSDVGENEKGKGSAPYDDTGDERDSLLGRLGPGESGLLLNENASKSSARGLLPLFEPMLNGPEAALPLPLAESLEISSLYAYRSSSSWLREM